ncbi:MAG: hypothetical protein HYY42_02415 [Chloroflexi bacterium]|nr:hypothetical protein [Chloroflexota bacterium]
MCAIDASVVRARGGCSTAGLHWAKRPLPEPPRTRRVSKWTRLPLDGFQEKLEEWLHEQSVSFTYDGD